MRTVTYEEFLKFDPIPFGMEGTSERLKAHFDRFGGKVSALDILNLDDVSAACKLWLVLREEFIPAPILHEFACVCAECALSLEDNPDPRSIKAIEVKRAWLRGEAADSELEAAWDAARSAVGAWAANDAARAASRAAATRAAWVPAWAAAWHATKAAVRASAWDASDGAWDAAREAQVAYLIMTLETLPKTVTYEEFLKLNPWLEEEGKAEQIKAYFVRYGGRMSALDILYLDDVSEEDRLWSVLYEELIPAPILHEFACVYAEYALSLIKNPDPRSVNAIKVKRAWLRGEATDEELAAARDAACDAYDAAWKVAYAAARYDARSAAWAPDVCAAKAARRAASDALDDAWDVGCADARYTQVAYLIMALEAEE